MKNNYRNPSLPVAERVRRLLKQMTLREKVGQMNQPLYGWQAYRRKNGRIALSAEFKRAVTRLGIGALYGLFRADGWSGRTRQTGLGPADGARAANLVQRYVRDHTRLGIPLLLSEECPHGHMALDATVFPAPITLASTWNPELARRAGAIAAREARARGAHIGYGPILDLARDPRWSRVEETFGEDPFLAGRFGAAMVQGLQGRDLKQPDAVISTLKHFAAHGTPEGGHNQGAVHAGPRELHEIYLPAFAAAIRAGAQSVMAAYHEIDGIPCPANPALLRGILKKRWGFRGVVVADGNAIDLLVQHRVAASYVEAGAIAARAGVDLSLWDQSYLHLLAAVESGRVPLAVIDEAVARILRLKFMLGLFENPYVDEQRAAVVIGAPAHRDLSRQIAREGIVLLKNEGRLLPLRKNIRSLAVIGPNAHHNIYNQLGDYTAPQAPESVATLWQGIRAKVSLATRLRYAQGCGIRQRLARGIAAAVAAARQAELAIVAVGGSSARNPIAASAAPRREIYDADCGEGYDCAELELAGAQLELVQAVRATGVPVIAVLIQGRPYNIAWLAEHVPAILLAWYPGPEGGNAIADVLFGDYNPAGRLPVSIPRSAGQLPVFYNHKPVGRQNYTRQAAAPLYPFGHGLSYTKFVYSRVRLSRRRICAGADVELRVDVRNRGRWAGDEVVQLYVRDEQSAFTRPVAELKGFQRVRLAPRETRTIRFAITPDLLQCLDARMNPVVEPGRFSLGVGGDRRCLLTAELEVSAASGRGRAGRTSAKKSAMPQL